MLPPPLPEPSDSEPPTPSPPPSKQKPRPDPEMSLKSTSLRRSHRLQASSRLQSSRSPAAFPPVDKSASSRRSPESKTYTSGRGPSTSPSRETPSVNPWTTEDTERLVRFLERAIGPLTIKIVSKYIGRETTDVAAAIVSLRQSAEAVRNDMRQASGKRKARAPEIVEQSDSRGSNTSHGYIRLTITDDTLTYKKASKLLAELRGLEPIVTESLSFYIWERKTASLVTINARTCCAITVPVMDKIHTMIVKNLPGCNYEVTNRDIGGPPL
ncbi:hypothetical protein LX36DRAFT_713290 [Colletotrichum falcatum]|nr:hypothetical protein LX36DRAFT_713290 [Colletotrichum falcatum]